MTEKKVQKRENQLLKIVSLFIKTKVPAVFEVLYDIIYIYCDRHRSLWILTVSQCVLIVMLWLCVVKRVSYGDRGPVTSQIQRQFIGGKYYKHSKKLLITTSQFCSVVGWKEGCAGSKAVRLGLLASLQNWTVITWTITK